MQAALIKHINAPIASKLGLINAFSGIFGCLAQGAGALSAVLSAASASASASASAGRASLHRVRSSDPGYSRARGDGRRLRCSGSDLRPAISSLPHDPSLLQLHRRGFAQATAKYSDDARWRTLACAGMWLGHWDRRPSQRRCSALTGWQARSLCLLSSSTSALPPARSQHLHTPPSQQHVAHHLPLPLWCRCGHNTPPRDGPPCTCPDV
jgi:hypothetical protein